MKTEKTIKMNIPDYWSVGKESPFKPIKIQSNKKIKSMITDIGQSHQWNSHPWTKGGQFSWTKDKAIPKKDMNYKQANQFFSLCPIGDTDRDGVPNWRDCKPYDPTRQGKHFDAFKKKVSRVKEKIQTSFTDSEKSPEPLIQTRLTDFPGAEIPNDVIPTKPTPKDKPKKRKYISDKKEEVQPETEPTPDIPQPDWYMFVKFADRKWEQVAVLKQNEVRGAVEDFKKNFPNVEDIQLSQNPKLLGKLNRKLAVQHAKKVVSEYAKRQQLKRREDLHVQGLKREITDLGKRPDIPIIPAPSSIGLATPSKGEYGRPDLQDAAATPQQAVKISIPQPFGVTQPVDARSQLVQPDHPKPGEEALPGLTSPELDKELPEREDHRRIIPPGPQQEYAPVAREQPSVYTPPVRVPYQDQQRPIGVGGMGGKIVSGRMLPSVSAMTPSRPPGIIPIAEFRHTPIRFMTFGMRVKE